jgi:hypothetical protein
MTTMSEGGVAGGKRAEGLRGGGGLVAESVPRRGKCRVCAGRKALFVERVVGTRVVFGLQ